jgi:predicted nucleotidyltransferase
MTPYILVQAYEVSEKATSSIIRIICTDDGYRRFFRNFSTKQPDYTKPQRCYTHRYG